MITIQFFKVGITIILGMVVLNCSSKEQQAEEKIRPVRYTEVYSTGADRVRVFSGAAKAGVETNLSFKVSGTVNRVHVNVGDKVKTGQLIAELDTKDYRLRFQEAEASLEQALAQARNAESNYERTKGLYENQNASVNDLDAARTASESADAAVRSIDNRLEQARLQLGYCKLAAPVNGAIARVLVEENENVSQGKTVVELSSGAIPEVELAIPEVLISQIHKNDRVTLTFDAIPGKVYTAYISEVGVSASRMTNAFPVIIKLIKSYPEILPGMIAEAAFSFEASGGKERFIIPSVAVVADRSGRFVYIAEPAGDGLALARRREVTVGELTPEGLEIFEGLQDGDLVITAGVSKIKDGMKVRLPGNMEG